MFPLAGFRRMHIIITHTHTHVVVVGVETFFVVVAAAAANELSEHDESEISCKLGSDPRREKWHCNRHNNCRDMSMVPEL
jgi:hypothetical protein